MHVLSSTQLSLLDVQHACLSISLILIHLVHGGNGSMCRLCILRVSCQFCMNNFVVC